MRDTRRQPSLQCAADGGGGNGGAPDSELAEASGSAARGDTSAPDPELGEPDGEAGEKSRVVFRMAHGVAFGEQLKVVGDGPVLGDWDITQAPPMTWGEGDNWTLEADMAGGSYDFKFVVQREGASADDSDWEAGANRSLFVPNMPTSSAITVNGTWSNTSSTFLSMSLDDDDDELEGIWQAALKGAQQSKRPDAVRSADLSALGAASDAEVEPMASGEARPVMGPEDLPPATELPSDASSEKSESEVSPTADSEAGSGSGASSSEQDPLPPNRKPTSNGSSGGGGGSRGSGNGSGEVHAPLEAAANPIAEAVDSAATQVINTAVAPEVETKAASVGEVLAAVAGLAATGIVAWSLATLKATGCGLPPGPGGVLGGLEGVSYLTVVGLAVWRLSARLKSSSGSSPTAGPGLLLGVAEGGAYSAIALGLAVLVLQVSERGFVPSALPDSHCYGEGSGAAAQVSSRS